MSPKLKPKDMQGDEPGLMDYLFGCTGACVTGRGGGKQQNNDSFFGKSEVKNKKNGEVVAEDTEGRDKRLQEELDGIDMFGKKEDLQRHGVTVTNPQGEMLVADRPHPDFDVDHMSLTSIMTIEDAVQNAKNMDVDVDDVTSVMTMEEQETKNSQEGGSGHRKKLKERKKMKKREKKQQREEEEEKNEQQWKTVHKHTGDRKSDEFYTPNGFEEAKPAFSAVEPEGRLDTS